MSDAPLHRLYYHYSELPYSLRVVYTASLIILGFGYLFALIYLFHAHAGRDGNPNMLSYEDIVLAYRGSGKGSRLEAALRGPMSTMLPQDEVAPLIRWVQEGANRESYETQFKPVLEKRCASCHDGSNPHLPNLIGYDNLKKVTEKDTGADIFTLVRVSHIHLFGFTFIFFVMGTIFSHAYLRPVWFKCAVAATPFVCVVLDVGAWYITKIYEWFAWVVMLAGGVMGACFAFMWFVSMYQLWFSKTPEPVTARDSGDGRAVG
ncbi:MAG: hypothetical protein HY017_09030 [Betaproteobacteria bacterium]|nr:hypothetical protein [Betaproteobacteria bacterium]